MSKKTVDEDVEELFGNEEFDEDKEFFPSWLKKGFFIFMTVLSVGLMISFMFIQFPIANIIMGQISSEPINTRTSTLTIHNTTLVFEQHVINMMFSTYNENLDVETSLCLEGTTDGSTYYVTNSYEPELFSQSYTHVSHETCSDETIIMFHTHPYKSCLASDQDRQTLARNQELRNPDIVMLIMCEPNRFTLER